MSRFNQYAEPLASSAVDRMLAMLDMSKMKPETKQQIRAFLQRCTAEIINELRCALRVEIAGIEEREQRIAEASDIIKQAEEQRELYPDPRARQAMVMYNDIVNRYVKDNPVGKYVYMRIDDEQAYRNAILSAGRIVAAYLDGKENEETK